MTLNFSIYQIIDRTALLDFCQSYSMDLNNMFGRETWSTEWSLNCS